MLLQRFDRLTRSISDTQEFIDLFKEFNVDVWSISDGGIVDITSSNGRFMALLKGLFGQHERELTAERIKADTVKVNVRVNNVNEPCEVKDTTFSVKENITGKIGNASTRFDSLSATMQGSP